MATQVRETSAGKSVSAFIVMNKKGAHVATVNAHYANTGRVSVDVWNTGAGSTERCLKAALKAGVVTPSHLENVLAVSRAKRASWGEQDHESLAAYDLFGLQQGSASGGGYDKLAAAIGGMFVDGIQLTNHCGSDEASKKLMRAYVREMCKEADGPKRARKYWDDKAEKIGACFANWDGEKGRFTSLHIRAGLDRLKGMGYTVIQAI